MAYMEHFGGEHVCSSVGVTSLNFNLHSSPDGRDVGAGMKIEI